MKAARIHFYGGPDVIKIDQIPIPKLQPGRLLVKNSLVGVNWIDIYQRKGIYRVELPHILGRDAAGIIHEVPEEPSENLGFKPGDRVVYGPFNSGSYADFTVVSSATTIKIPHFIPDEQAVFGMVSGLSAHFLTRDTFKVNKGQTVLIHAVTGGLGLWLCQLCKHDGATVIGTTSSEEKAKFARDHGCDHVVLYSTQDWVKDILDYTNGKGVHAVFDSVGKDTFDKSLKCLAHRGSMVLCGHTSGKIPFIDIDLLASKSISLSRPTLHDFIDTREEFEQRMHDIFHWLRIGAVKAHVMKPFKLEDASQAHQQLEERHTIGKVVLVP